MDKKKYQKMFIRESQENLDILNSSLLSLEKKPNDKKSATELMRAAHTLKSSAAAMGHTQMSQLAHAIEDIFDQVRAGKSHFSPKNSNTLFNTFDLIDKSLQAIKNNQPELDTSSTIEELRGLNGSNADKTDPSNPRAIRENPREGAALAERPETLRPLEDIKVDITTLDTLMSLSEELLVNKMRLAEVVKSKKYEELPVALDMLGRLVTDTQYNIMQARMVPLGQIFDRFPRMVRDLANKEKKSVDLEIEGGEIELDRTVIDKIGEPLVHLLRNAVDHGIPAPVPKGTTAGHVRNKISNGAGKETKGGIYTFFEEKVMGKIQLKAKREKSHVIIEVINSGNSLDLEKIKEKAVQKHIVDARRAENLSQEEIVNLIYHPELSTSAQVTETSGRGIGLNIVKTRIESLGGTVSVESPVAGQEGGAKFTLRLPLTIAIIQALLVKVKEEIFAIPITNIDRSVKVQPDFIKKALDREVAIVDKVNIPLIRLEKLFNIKIKEQETSKSALVVIIKKSFLLDTGEEEEKPIFGLVVDGLVSEQEIVIKPLTGILKQNKGFAGVTILGDGRPALILDVTNLI